MEYTATREEGYVAERPPARSAAAVGLIAGIAGGLLMAMWSMGYAAVTGIGLWFPLKQVAATVFGIEALVGGPAVLLVGALLHLLVAGAFGIVFAVLLPRGTNPGVGALVGMVYGVLVLLFTTLLVLPLVNQIMRERVELVTMSWIVTHLIYGATLGLLVPVMRRGVR